MGKLRLPCIIGVAGGPASGKSLVTEKIMERLETLNQGRNKQVCFRSAIDLDIFTLKESLVTTDPYGV
ncbi:hypothetical protein Y032_0180g787 [Ancylostoma ceylanicum]|nr:hypothetical protein Y032_0180g787 [Ancylostoma ceylanicum]